MYNVKSENRVEDMEFIGGYRRLTKRKDHRMVKMEHGLLQGKEAEE
jgi:hypothetical protein